jgi:TolB protein
VIPAAGGQARRLNTLGVSSPSEPDWSPDGKWIAFTCQHGRNFSICLIPVNPDPAGEARGGEAIVLAEGEDPSWSPNSRTLAYARRAGGQGNYVLSVLDVMTKQYKDVSRISGISSQSQPSWAK